MLLILLAFLMKFVDITKLQQQPQQQQPSQRPHAVDNVGLVGGNNVAWQHVALRNKTDNSNSSSTSSGCASNASSTKENRSYTERNHTITPQQLQQIRHYQRLQQQQLQLLQQQLLQRRRLQQQLRAEGVLMGGAQRKPSSTSTAALTCNQEYLRQQRKQQEQQQRHRPSRNDNNRNKEPQNFNQQYLFNLQNEANNNANYNKNNNKNSNNNNGDYNNCGLMLRGGFAQGQKSRRGMTEFSTNNDIGINSHHSQPLLHNSPHHQPRNQRNSYQLQHQQQQHHNSPQHNTHQVLSHHNQNYHNQQIHSHHHHHPPSSHHQLANINNHLAYKQATHNNKNNQQTLPLNSSANIHNHCASTETNPISTTTTATKPTSVTQQHSPLQYKKPLNSPNNSPFAYAYYGANHHYNQQQQQQQQQQQAQFSLQSPQYLATTTAQQQQQQQLRLLHNKLSQTNYQQHLNDIFLQQQHLQQQQQQLLSAAGASKKDENGVCIGGGDELSDECLKQNVAIVLNNLDRYNNALRSIILNEQVSNSLFDDSLLDFSSISNSNSNNNFLLSNENSNCSSKMATAATPESDYNSNATTPGSRVGSNMFPTQQHLLLQQQQHDNVVGYTTQTTGGGVGGGGGWDTGGVGFCSNVVGASIGASNNLNCSLASSHDFTHDNSDYQWFLDYGYRDGCSMQRSVLSSLSASYNGIGELLYYEDLAKNIDANLAEVDMESFRAEDIHSLLSQLPSYCKGIGSGANGRLQQSLMQQHMLPAHNVSQTSNQSSTNELIDNSICKSELLFSPVKESHISVDSLDMDAYPDDGDIILTCKANKDNYTIAFEGSVLYSDESFYAEPSEISLKNKQNFINLHSNLDDIVKRKSLEVSMSRSEHQMTTWSKLKKGNALQRYPSGNNNTAENVVPMLHAPHCTVRKSSSLPNLRSKKDSTACTRQQLNVSHVSTTTLESCRSRNLLPMCQMPISCSSITVSTSERLAQNSQQQQYQKQQLHLQLQNNQQQPRQQTHHHHHHHHNHHRNHHNNTSHQHLQQDNASCCSIASATSATLQKQSSGNGNTSSGTSAVSSNQPAFNLVKLFIKQKSCSSSSEEHASAQTCMDVSSGCWPSSDAAGSSGSSFSLEQRLRKKSMNDSGKGSALSRHDEEELRQGAGVGDSYLVDNVDEQHAEILSEHARRHNEVFYEEERTLTASPTGTKELRRRSLPLRHPQVCQLAQQHQHNNNGSSAGSLHSSDASRSNSEQLTQVYLSSDEAGGAVERKKDFARRRELNNVNQQASANSEMITRSMQTSCGSLSTRSSINDRFRFVPPSFLAKLNNLGEEKQAPIYVIYPNYALPDLGFVKTNNTTDVIFSPFNFQMALTGSGGGSAAAVQKQPRYTEDEILKNIDHKHVVDWKSLATLLPAEYRKRLQHIPEVGNLNLEQGGDITSQKPLFCMTPPIRRPQRSAQLCDCAQYFQQTAQTQQQQEGSSSSGSSQQPSSGYRGSSTLLTDSELGDTATGASSAVTDPLKQMYVYQYEQQQQQQQQRNDSGIDSPAAKPIPHPRGILRKASSQGGVERNKRNSMFEEKQTKLTKQEKRRSLQEPAYNQHLAGGGSMDELYTVLPEEEVFEEQLVEAYFAGMLQTNQRLSRKDMDARARAENFLSSLPRSELKYYAEIAAILESSEDQHQAAADQYDAAALKKEVSRALSQQKKVSFNENEQQQQLTQQQQQQFLQAEARHKRFSTPPNSPNISIAGGLRMPLSGAVARRCSPLDTQAARRSAAAVDSKEQQKINSNRFKRLQIQWELLSKDSSMMLKDLACEQETKSGGSTPTAAQAVAAAAAAAAAQRSRIPRPVSYPAGKRSLEPLKPVEKKGFARIIKPVVSPQIARVTNQDASKTTTTTRSPSRIVPPKRYSMASPSAATGATTPGSATATTPTTRARTPTSRPTTAPVTAPNTPKRRVQSPRTIPRVR